MTGKPFAGAEADTFTTQLDIALHKMWHEGASRREAQAEIRRRMRLHLGPGPLTSMTSAIGGWSLLHRWEAAERPEWCKLRQCGQPPRRAAPTP
jgi:hypothetical protein